ncbi:MAG: Lacal_2735 family protein [Flavobacteriaceae bacterium]|nr:MAG: Lacal_2735 family protein [Flavobacteriaceae bacterium]
MFGLFKKKTELEKLRKKYQKLTKEAYHLQSVNRRASDQKYGEAQHILNKIDVLKKG